MGDERKKGMKASQRGRTNKNELILSNQQQWSEKETPEFLHLIFPLQKAKAGWNKIKITYTAMIFLEHIDCKRQAGKIRKQALDEVRKEST